MGFKVGQEYRKNILSFSEGGVTVEVEKIDGKRFEYPNVKYPKGYIKKLLENPDVKDAWVKE